MRTRIYILYLTLLNIAFVACHRKEDKFTPYYGTVNVLQPLQVSNSAPSFSSGEKVYFTASFDKNALWTVTIVSQLNGAKQVISGSSKELNASNTLWDGSSDGLPVFVSGNCTATLSFQGDVETYTTTLKIVSAKNFDAGAILISDFYHNVPGPYAFIWKTESWPRWDYSTTNTFTTKFLPLPDSTAYVQMEGTPWQGPAPAYQSVPPISPYVTNFRIPADTIHYVNNKASGYGKYFPLYPEASLVYFNIMVCNTGTPTRLLVIFDENGGDDNAKNGGVSYNYNIIPNWKVGTWELISVPYEHIAGVNAKADKITSVHFVLLTTITDQNILNQGANYQSNPQANVSAAFDHAVFTLSKPFVP